MLTTLQEFLLDQRMSVQQAFLLIEQIPPPHVQGMTKFLQQYVVESESKVL
ncbi:hypothetical protein SAL_0555 [Streptococcus agalactiae 515]|nr:hypothetical protein SAL_0555 [Streptococcus agalactiae 515]